jgi:hypothetical protein
MPPTTFTRGDGGQVIPPPSPPEEPARSPERARLANAIADYRDLTEAHARVSLALDRLRNELFEKYRPALGAARERLEDAQADEAYRLTAELLDELAESNPIAEATAALDAAQHKVDQYHESRQLLETELARRVSALNLAQHDLDRAVAAVVLADPVKQAAVDEFFSTGRHLLRLAQILRTLGIRTTGVNHDEVGLGLQLTEIIRPGSQGISSFIPDANFSMALADLRCDADTRLPDLPVREPKESDVRGFAIWRNRSDANFGSELS